MNELLGDKEAEWVATQIMFKLKDEYPEFSGDEFCEMCRERSLTPQQIKALSGALFKRFQSVGYICKTGRTKLSNRNNSSLIVIWTRCAIDKLPSSGE